MDYKLGALKLLCCQVKETRPAAGSDPEDHKSMYGTILFQRVWVQGVLVSVWPDKEEGKCVLLDDGTGTVDLLLSGYGDFMNENWRVGMYVMAVGVLVPRGNEVSIIEVHKLLDLSACPNREAMWYLEVIEVYKLFYEPSFGH